VVVTLAVLFFVFAVGTREATAQVDASELPPGQVEVDRAEARLRFDGPEIAGLQVPLASLGERALALSIDLTLLGLVYLGAARVFDLPLTDWVLVLTLGFALRHVYFVAFEHRWQGATPGKRLLGLRVMARDGRGLDLRSLLVRNLLRDAELVSLLLLVRLVDQLSPRTPLPETWVLVVLAFAAIFAVPLLGAERRRLGDFVGDTVVIRTPNVPHLPEDALIACDADTAFTREQLGIYGTHEVRRLAELLDALVVEGEGAYDLASEVARTIAERVGVDPETIRDPEQFLRSFYRAQRARVEHDALRGRR